MVYNERRRGETKVRVVGRNNITFSHTGHHRLLWPTLDKNQGLTSPLFRLAPRAPAPGQMAADASDGGPAGPSPPRRSPRLGGGSTSPISARGKRGEGLCGRHRRHQRHGAGNSMTGPMLPLATGRRE